jgi:hypothetical protein
MCRNFRHTTPKPKKEVNKPGLLNDTTDLVLEQYTKRLGKLRVPDHVSLACGHELGSTARLPHRRSCQSAFSHTTADPERLWA